MKPTVYLDATIPSFYFEDRPGTIIQAWHEITVDFWDAVRFNYDLFVSDETLRELQEVGYAESKRQRCLALVDGLPRLAVTPEVTDLAEYFVRHGAMPINDLGDAFHLVCYLVPPAILSDVELQASGQRQQIRAHPDSGVAPPPPGPDDSNAGAAFGDQPMIDILTIVELRETRRRLAEQSGLDVQRYATQLQQTAPGKREFTCPHPFCPNRCRRPTSRSAWSPSTPRHEPTPAVLT